MLLTDGSGSSDGRKDRSVDGQRFECSRLNADTRATFQFMGMVR